MMNRSTFNETLKSLIEKRLGDNYIVELQNITMLTVTLTALEIRKTRSPIGVTLYLNCVYDEYRITGEEVSFLAEKLLNQYHSEIMEASLSTSDLDVLRDKRSVYHKIFYKVINKDKNKELLKNVPHIRAVEGSDLVLIFCILVDECENQSSSTIITNYLMEHFKFSLSELLTVAKENTPQLFPPQLRSMAQVVANIFPIVPVEFNNSVFVLSNTQNLNGASVMCYEHMLEDVAHRLNGNFFVLPSSLHELIIVKDNNDICSSYLCEMVKDINQTEVREEDFLSNTVFYYNTVNNSLSIA